jgi:iron-sulfur cluster assembly protein
MTTTEIEITPQAANELTRIKVKNDIPESHGLRIGVKGGGCSGFNYVMGFDEKSREEDLIINSHGLTCFIDPNSLLHLSGTRIDFVDEPNRRGFIFDNPNVQPSCDCGDTCCG